jgi:uncharacterized DUF497 family protein
MGLRFEWDANKALSNLRKHKISFEEACTVFGDPNAITITDSEHGQGEPREITIGASNKMTIAVVCHTDRSGKVRIISARKATKKEQKQYSENLI